MQKLSELDHQRRIRLVDLHEPQFERDYPHIDRNAALAALHGELPDGQVLKGLDTSHRAWSLVGRGWLTAPLRWPLLRLVADGCYRLFARHRYRISLWLTGRARCDGNRCGPKT
ncbi:DUF393 domain-containing protein [Exilibacterium tricleocarpae]|uniref:DUF393 domain-containing protein n=2 Tax=Exilibacterium tricleocarpae TaxID=2591008 RepID=A0A545TP25_9GAMM|nr:DUF393 domain-containing protein [Exilibacterium tricleocarpae]